MKVTLFHYFAILVCVLAILSVRVQAQEPDSNPPTDPAQAADPNQAQDGTDDLGDGQDDDQEGVCEIDEPFSFICTDSDDQLYQELYDIFMSLPEEDPNDTDDTASDPPSDPPAGTSDSPADTSSPLQRRSYLQRRSFLQSRRYLQRRRIPRTPPRRKALAKNLMEGRSCVLDEIWRYFEAYWDNLKLIFSGEIEEGLWRQLKNSGSWCDSDCPLVKFIITAINARTRGASRLVCDCVYPLIKLKDSYEDLVCAADAPSVTSILKGCSRLGGRKLQKAFRKAQRTLKKAEKVGKAVCSVTST